METNIELLAYQRLAQTGLSPRELAEMDMDAYARITGRATLGETAVKALEHDVPGTPRQAPQPTESMPAQEPASEPTGVDLSNLSMDEYAALRGQLGIGQGQKEGKGIFSSVGSQSPAYRQATAQQSGRTAYANANIESAPRLEGRTVLREDDHRDYRPASARFSTPGNSFQL